MKRFFDSKLVVALVIAILLVAVLVLLLVVAGRTDLVKYLILALIVMGVLWIGIELFLRSRKKRKSRQFDERVAAKEGIEDRKREWASWSAELDRQGIDRYELPFYLLLGEPQSGKSILLQNSDLHFPFGQQRLSGVGGTRGCDWWFTDQAVVLDLAGRLFTHQGGASDAFEWESFLELLGDFRPLCPANGIILVLPCDNLLEDQPDATLHKAGRMQAALVTLINKLQAKLPVYVVLTKADKIFGFAECVHRLDTPQRQQMFGWSRPSERMESTFELAEAHDGFRTIVARSALLRAEMLGTARLPDDSAAVQRAFAYPDELASLWPNLELYLRTIFTDTALVERLYFRGLYLTSGLQTGVPIAKICASLLTGAREADSRALETVFTKQRAYFIRDLVRERVFAERSLVRPTSLRVKRAQRSARIGYGAAAAIALFAVGSSALYVSQAGDGMHETHSAAIRAVASAAEANAGVPESVTALEAVKKAMEEKVNVIDDTGGSLKAAFDDLYVGVLGDALSKQRERATHDVRARLTNAKSYAEFAAAYEDAVVLLGRFDASEHRDLLVRGETDAQVKRSLPEQIQTAGEIERDAVTLKAIDPSSSAADFSILADAALSACDRALTPGCRWQIGDDLGRLIARVGIESAYAGMQAAQRDRSSGAPVALVNAAAAFAHSVELFKQLEEARKDQPLVKSVALDALRRHGELREKLSAWRATSSSADGSDDVRASIEGVFGPSPSLPAEKFTPPPQAKDTRLVAAAKLAALVSSEPSGGRSSVTLSEFVHESGVLLGDEPPATRDDPLRAPTIAATFSEFVRGLGTWEQIARGSGATPELGETSDRLLELVSLSKRVRSLTAEADLRDSTNRVELLLQQGCTAWSEQAEATLTNSDSAELFEALGAALHLQLRARETAHPMDLEKLAERLEVVDGEIAAALSSPRFDPIKRWRELTLAELAASLSTHLLDAAQARDQELRRQVQEVEAQANGKPLFPRSIQALPRASSAGAASAVDLIAALAQLERFRAEKPEDLAVKFANEDRGLRSSGMGPNAKRAWEVMAKRVALEVCPKLADQFTKLDSAHRAELAYLFASADEMSREGVFTEGARKCQLLLERTGPVRTLAAEYGIDAYDAGVLRVDLEDDLTAAERERFEAVRFLMRLAFKLDEPALAKPLVFQFESLTPGWRAPAAAYATVTARGINTPLGATDPPNQFSLDWELDKHTSIRLAWTNAVGSQEAKHLIDIPGALAPCFLWWWANGEGSSGVAELPVGAAKVQIKVAIKDKESGAAMRLPVRPRRPQ